jgi:phage shock protein A
VPDQSFRRVLVAIACAAALLGAGCSGDDETETYREDLTEAKEEFDGVLKSAAASSQTPEGIERDIDRLRAGIAEFKEKLRDLDPPEEAENEQRALNEALADYDDAVGATKAAIQGDDKKAVVAEVARMRTTGAALDQALETLVAAVE